MKNFIALILFATGIAAWYFYQQQQKAATELTEITQNLTNYEQSVLARRSEFKAFVSALDLQKKIQAKQQEITAIQAKERGLKEKISALGREKSRLVSSARQSVIGQTFPELLLTDGRKLAQVKILKADDSGLAVSLNSGIQKIAPSELPENLRLKLHYGN